MEHWSEMRARPGPKAALCLLAFVLLATPVSAQSSLKSRRDYIVGDHPVGVVATDYDRDGFLDLITVNQQTGGNGDVALITPEKPYEQPQREERFERRPPPRRRGPPPRR